MKKKSNVGLVVLMGVVAVMIAVCLFICVFCLMNNQVQKLNPAPAIQEQEALDSEYVRVEVKNTYEGPKFSSTGSTQTDESTDESESNGDYICSYSSERLLTRSDVQSIISSCDETMPENKTFVQMMINELYAKNGYKFETESIQKYFETKTWYQDISERNSDMDSIHAQMTSIEKENVEFLQGY